MAGTHTSFCLHHVISHKKKCRLSPQWDSLHARDDGSDSKTLTVSDVRKKVEQPELASVAEAGGERV